MLAMARELRGYARASRAEVSQRFFKTGKGEYGEGDRFIGVTVPDVRRVAKMFCNASMGDVQALLRSTWHEDRLLGLIIWTMQFEKGTVQDRKRIFDAYRASTARINNWDLVDVSAPRIVGEYLFGRSRAQVKKWARSKDMWERRIAIVSTLAFIVRGDASSTFVIADMLMNDREDLIHKATGWMLREVGKRCGEKLLTEYLLPRYRTMPRTMLRYAIERYAPSTKKRWLLGTMC